MEDCHDAQFRTPAERVMKAVDWNGLRAVFRSWAAALLMALAVMSTPAWAHEEEEENAQTEQAERSASGAGALTADHERMGGMNMDMDHADLPFFPRLLGWLGRLHPFLVHFPIAFFPAALFTAVVGRRRPAFAAPVQFLVVAGAIFAPLAAAAGWLAGASADPEPILEYHRWLGVAMGAAGAGLGIWAWRRPWEDRGAGMILALTIMTIAVAVQGFLGAGVTHGIEHLMF